MKAMILAAGLGTRLRPLTETVPKPLVEVGGRPLISYPLAQLRHAGVREVVVNVHHLAAQVRAALGDGARYGVRIHYSDEPELLDTGGGVLQARRWLDAPFFILNADSIQDVPLEALAQEHRRRGGIATLVLRDDPEAERYGLLDVDAEQRLRRFRGEPKIDATSLTGLMYAGVSLWEPRVFDFMTKGRATARKPMSRESSGQEPARSAPTREESSTRVFSLTRDVLPRLLAVGEAVFGFRYEGYWRVIDSPADLERGRREIEAGQRLSYLGAGIS